MRNIVRSATLAALLAAAAGWGAIASAQPAPGFGYVGKIKPRSTAEIVAAGHSSPFGIGGETTDRGFSTFSNWQSYVGPLGAQKIRVQSGWHFIETAITTPATYNFATLDAIVDGVRAQGVQPLVFLGYGNERAGCTNCGTRGLGGALPTGTGRDRFIAFVKATVKRYNEPVVRVTDWQIWNEPDGHVDVNEYAQLITATAQAIKSVQPNAKIMVGAFTAGVLGGTGSSGLAYAQTALDYFAANKGPTVPNADITVGFHPYWGLPDYDAYASMETRFNAFKNLVESKGFKIRQDENGAPSTPCQYFALCGTAQWDEPNQGKYMLRRMLGDFWRGIETSIFTITDLHYDSTKNTKGLLETGTWVWDPNAPGPKNGDQTVKRKKLAYGSFQNVTSVFDNRLQRVTNHGCTAPWGYTVHAYTRDDNGVKRHMLAVWRKTTELPANSVTSLIDVTCTNFHFARMAATGLMPRFADLLDGRVYAAPTSVVSSNSAAANDVSIRGLPVADHPVLLADQGIVLFQP